MSFYVVHISMRSSTHDYAALWAALREAHAQRLMDASWLLDLKAPLPSVTNALLSHCAKGDGLFVVELSPETRWSGTGLSDAEKAWFRERSVATIPAPARHMASNQQDDIKPTLN